MIAHHAPRTRRVAAVALLITLLVGLWIGAVAPALAALTHQRDALAQAERQRASLMLSIDRLSAEQAGLSTLEPQTVLWTGERVGAVSASVQGLLGEVARRHGVSLRTIASIDAAPIASFRALGFRLEAEGPLDRVTALLRDVESQEPPLLVTRLNLRRGGARPTSDQPMLFMRLELAAPVQLSDGS